MRFFAPVQTRSGVLLAFDAMGKGKGKVHHRTGHEGPEEE